MLDLHAPYIRETTGLQYESFVAYFRGDPPLTNDRNASVSAIRRCPEWAGAPAEAFWRAYDAAQPRPDNIYGDYGNAHVQRHNAAVAGVDAARSRRRAARTRDPHPVQAPAHPVHEADQPQI